METTTLVISTLIAFTVGLFLGPILKKDAENSKNKNNLTMKTKSLLFALLLCATFSNAQVGIKFGSSTAILANENHYDINERTTEFVGGMYAKIHMGKVFDLQPEILYSQVGNKSNYGPKYNFRTNYLKAPLALSINLGALSLQAGGYASYLLSPARVVSIYSDRPMKWSVKDWIYNHFDYGFVGGFEIDLYGGSIGARYNYGRANVIKKGYYTSDAFGKNNHSVEVTLSYPFRIRQK